MSADSSFVVLLASSLLGATACGDDSETQAQSSCAGLVDAFARSWERCGRDTYESAHDLWREALACDTVDQVDSAKYQECRSDLEELSCASVTRGDNPASCTGALSGE